MGQFVAGTDGECQFVGRDRPFEILGPIPADAITVGVPQIVLGHRPVFRKVVAGVDLQCQFEGGDRPFEILGPIPLRAFLQ